MSNFNQNNGEQLDRIEKKLDLIINTFGLKAALKSESAFKVQQLASMDLDSLKAMSREIGRRRTR